MLSTFQSIIILLILRMSQIVGHLKPIKTNFQIIKKEHSHLLLRMSSKIEQQILIYFQLPV